MSFVMHGAVRGLPRPPGAAFNIRQPIRGRLEQGFLLLAAGTPIGAVKFGSRVGKVNGQRLKLWILGTGRFVEHSAVVHMEPADDEHGDHARFFQRR